MIVLLAAIPLAVAGLLLGLLGGGGVAVSTPALVYLLGLAPREAIATSLVMVASTSLAGVIAYARAGHVRWRLGLVFGPVAMAAAFAGGFVGRQIPDPVLLVAFALVLLVSAASMWRGRRDPAPDAADEVRLSAILVQAAGVGLLAGLLGIGGGFIIVPVLVVFARLPMRAAVGTALLVGGMNAVAGLAGQGAVDFLDPRLAATAFVASVVGVLLGVWSSSRVPQAGLRRGFAVMTASIALVMILAETLHLVG